MRIVGPRGTYPLDPRRAELCKMYIEKSARGQGLGRQLLLDLPAAARRGGFQEVWLKTNSALIEALALYRRHGFQHVELDHPCEQCDVAYLLRLE